MATVDITLTRAHKLAERMKQKINELRIEAQQLAQPQQVSGVAGDATIARLEGQGQRALVLLAEADRYSLALAELRAQIGEVNDRRGVSSKLAHLEHLNRQVAARKAMLPVRSDVGIPPAELKGYTPLAPESRSVLGGSVLVQILGEAAIQQLTTEIATLQREAFQLSDKIAEANAGRFAVALDDEILAAVTGQ